MKVPAAALRAGAMVLLAREPGGQREPVRIERVDNATPEVGQITWTFSNDLTHVIGAAEVVEAIA